MDMDWVIKSDREVGSVVLHDPMTAIRVLSASNIHNNNGTCTFASSSLNKLHILKMFENRVQRRILGPNFKELNGKNVGYI
jgi:hypothetical protein